jgi:hypothetical protein
MEGKAPSDTVESEAPPLGGRALEAYRRDLPRLLVERPGQWVAYHGDQLIDFAATPPELWQEIRRRHYRRRDCVVMPIEEDDMPEVVDTPYPFG